MYDWKELSCFVKLRAFQRQVEIPPSQLEGSSRGAASLEGSTPGSEKE